ncbi:MAG: hypothetical protein RR338_02550, partial [Clostridia bacterium]
EPILDVNGVQTMRPILAVYLFNDSLFADLSALFGTDAGKICISGLGLNKMMANALGGILSKVSTDATTSGDAQTSSLEQINGMENNLDYAYFKLMINPQLVCLQLNAAVINAVYHKIMSIRGEPAVDIIPDIGDIMLAIDSSNKKEGTILSLNLKFTENFRVAIDIKNFKLKKEDTTVTADNHFLKPLFSDNIGQGNGAYAYEKGVYRYLGGNGEYIQNADGTTYKYVGGNGDYIKEGLAGNETYKFVGAGKGNYIQNVDKNNKATYQEVGFKGNYNKEALGNTYTLVGFKGAYTTPFVEAFNITTGQIGLETVGVELQIDLTMQSAGLLPTDLNYDKSLAGWLINLVGGLLEGVAPFGEYKAMTVDEQKTVALGGYAGQRYSKDDASNTYIKNELGTFKFVAADINVIFAKTAFKVSIAAKINLNFAALMKYGIGGILYSDLALDIKFGAGSYEGDAVTLISLYYLGSSRLTKTSNIFELAPKDETKKQYFSDAAYVDATGLGFGKIKLSGFAGILGANQIVEAGTAALVAPDGKTPPADAGSQGTTSLGVVLEIQNGKIGLTVQRSMIDTIFKMAGLTIPDGLMPPIKDVGIEINYSDAGLTNLCVNATLDEVGTTMSLAIGGLKVAVGKEAFDSKTFIAQAKKGYGGLTFSKVGGLGGLIQGALDSLAPGLAIMIDKKTWSITTGRINLAKWTGEGEDMPTFAMLTGEKKMSVFTGNNDDKYRLTLDLKAVHPRHANNTGAPDRPFAASVILQHNSLLITNLLITNGLIETILKGALNVIALPADGTDLFNIMGTGADKGIYDYPKNASTAGAVESNATTAAADPTGWNKDRTSYSYPAKLDNLINKVDLNLFSGNGYMPYYSGMGAVDAGDPRFISIKITFNKDPFNELLLMVYALLLNIFRPYIDANQYNVEYFMGYKVEKGIITEEKYNIMDKNTKDDTVYGGKTGFGNSDGHCWWGDAKAKGQVTRLFDELDKLLKKGHTTQERVNFMEPFVRSFPYMLEKAVLTGIAGGTEILGSTVGALYPTLYNLADDTLLNLSKLVATILPLPFANGYADGIETILPSANIYLDLAPKANEY